jgi:hypothetical protein
MLRRVLRVGEPAAVESEEIEEAGVAAASVEGLRAIALDAAAASAAAVEPAVDSSSPPPFRGPTRVFLRVEAFSRRLDGGGEECSSVAVPLSWALEEEAAGEEAGAATAVAVVSTVVVAAGVEGASVALLARSELFLSCVTGVTAAAE